MGEGRGYMVYGMEMGSGGYVERQTFCMSDINKSVSWNHNIHEPFFVFQDLLGHRRSNLAIKKTMRNTY
jgi:hypothetical protein